VTHLLVAIRRLDPTPRLLRAVDRLLGRLPLDVETRIRERLGLDLFIVVAAVLVVLRLFDTAPWTSPLLDLHTYWATGKGVTYAGANPFLIGAYLYAPVFAQLLSPLTLLSWPVFAAVWTALIAIVFVWLAGRWAFPLLFSVAIALEFYLGQIDVFIAAAIVIGFRYPAVWAFPILTKVAPGIGLVWFLVRREWRNLAIALATTVGIAAISAMSAPELWRGWFNLLERSVTERQTIEGAYLAIPVWLRLPVALGVVVWGARTTRYWAVPVAVLLAMPLLWLNVFTLLVAAIPLREEPGLTPARAWLVRERLLPAPHRRAPRSIAPQNLA
jgi:Glycosyltransferase family 87